MRPMYLHHDHFRSLESNPLAKDNNKAHTLLLRIAAPALIGSTLISAMPLAAAVHEHRLAKAVTDLQSAAMTVALADAQSVNGVKTQWDLSPSLGLLRSDRELAFSVLEPEQRPGANELLNEVASYGLPSATGDHNHPHQHDDAHRLLEMAVVKASDSVKSTEGLALASLGITSIVVALTAWLVVRSRWLRAMAAGQLKASERLRRLINNSPDLILVIDQGGNLSYRSPSCSRYFGPEVATLDELLELCDNNNRERLAVHLRTAHQSDGSTEFEIVDLEGTTVCLDVQVSDLSADELVAGHLITARDITREAHLRNDLIRQARTDTLTGLANRRALTPAIDNAKSRMQADGTAMAVMMLDIDQFSEHNDNLGHHACDDLLRQLAERMESTVRADDTMLRLGSDDFAVIVSGINGPAEAWQLATRLLDMVEKPFAVGPGFEHLGLSIGLTVTDDIDHVPTLIVEADLALYESKRAGGGTAMMFETGMGGQANTATEITRALRAADYDSEFSIVYQPVVDLMTSETVSFEALLRWTSPTLGSVSPAKFIPIAEQSGEINAIGEWVLDQVCCQMASWTNAGIEPNFGVSFNVSPRQLADETFVAVVLAVVAKWDIPTRRLTAEVIESSVLDHRGPERQRLQELREAGIKISIDDFGSGYSNLGQLLRIPLDIIKIDRSLLLNLCELQHHGTFEGTDPFVIMEAVVSIAGVLGARVVCEGIETDEQRELLLTTGIDYLQGYLTGHPTDPESVARQLAAKDGSAPATMTNAADT